MAPSIRVRITRVLLDEKSLSELIDPFWLLILTKQYPYIADVGKKVKLICNDILSSQQTSTKRSESDDDFATASASGSGSIFTLDFETACQLWLDGCRLPSSERTDILRDNDSIVVKFTKHIFPSRDDHSVLNTKLKKIAVGDDDALLACIINHDEDKGHSLTEIKSRKRKRSNKNYNEEVENILDDTEPPCLVKKKKKKKKKKKSLDTDSDEPSSLSKNLEDVECEHSLNIHGTDNLPPIFQTRDTYQFHNDAGDGQTSVNMNDSEIEKEKKKLLSKLGSLAGAGDFQSNMEISEDGLENSMNENHVSSQKKRKRKRRKGKNKIIEEYQTVIKIEDKPKSSRLNLPWDKQPQNNKITFDSDDSEEDVAEVGKIKQEMVSLKENEKSEENTCQVVLNNDNQSNKAVKLNDSSSFVECKTESKRYKDLSTTSRKYLMRSTAGILESIRSSNREPTTNSKSFRKESPDAIKIKNFPLTESSHSTTITSVTPTYGDVPRINSKNQTVQSPLMKLETTASTGVDPNAKFQELLQRRRINNSTCSVNKSQNGMTICVRQKSPKWSLHKEACANPDTDVLTNVSTIKKLNGNGISVNGHSHSKDVEKVEVIPLDVESCPPLSGDPQSGDILAYKILEMNEDYTPAVSEFKTGKVLLCEDGLVTLKLFGHSAPKRQKGKFELIYDDEEDATDQLQTDEQICVQLISMIDTRLVQR